MKALLNIQLAEKPEEILFQTNHEELIRHNYPEVTHFSLDNFSDASLIEYALEFIQRSEKTLIVIESKNERANPNKLLKLINRLIRGGASNIKLIMLGENPTMEKMIKALDKSFGHEQDEEDLSKIAKALFS